MLLLLLFMGCSEGEGVPEGSCATYEVIMGGGLIIRSLGSTPVGVT